MQDIYRCRCLYLRAFLTFSAKLQIVRVSHYPSLALQYIHKLRNWNFFPTPLFQIYISRLRERRFFSFLAFLFSISSSRAFLRILSTRLLGFFSITQNPSCHCIVCVFVLWFLSVQLRGRESKEKIEIEVECQQQIIAMDSE